MPAAGWFASGGLHRDALQVAEDRPRPSRIAQYFKAHWRELIEHGFADAVRSTRRSSSRRSSSTSRTCTTSDAEYALLGRSGEALEWFSSSAAGPDRAFQLADIHSAERGEPAEAFDGLIAATEAYDHLAPHGYVWTFIAFLAPTLGELDIGEDAARRALEQARALGDLGHQADAHAAVAEHLRKRAETPKPRIGITALRAMSATSAGNLLATTAVANIKTARLWSVKAGTRRQWR